MKTFHALKFSLLHPQTGDGFRTLTLCFVSCTAKGTTRCCRALARREFLRGNSAAFPLKCPFVILSRQGESIGAPAVSPETALSIPDIAPVLCPYKRTFSQFLNLWFYPEWDICFLRNSLGDCTFPSRKSTKRAFCQELRSRHLPVRAPPRHPEGYEG